MGYECLETKKSDDKLTVDSDGYLKNLAFVHKYDNIKMSE
jgi:hypothetical protein